MRWPSLNAGFDEKRICTQTISFDESTQPVLRFHAVAVAAEKPIFTAMTHSSQPKQTCSESSEPTGDFKSPITNPMPEVHEILELDLLTLREHTERAGNSLDPEQLRGSIANLLTVSEVAVVRRGGALVAYAMLHPQEDSRWFVTGFNTHPLHRNAPVFKALFSQLMEVVARRGVTSLRSNVYRTNRLSMAFHKRLGFKVTRENPKGVEFTATVEELAAGKRFAAR